MSNSTNIKIKQIDLFNTLYDLDVPKDLNENNPEAVGYVKGRTHWGTNTVVKSDWSVKSGSFDVLDNASGSRKDPVFVRLFDKQESKEYCFSLAKDTFRTFDVDPTNNKQFKISFSFSALADNESGDEVFGTYSLTLAVEPESLNGWPELVDRLFDVEVITEAERISPIFLPYTNLTQNDDGQIAISNDLKVTDTLAVGVADASVNYSAAVGYGAQAGASAFTIKSFDKEANTFTLDFDPTTEEGAVLVAGLEECKNKGYKFTADFTLCADNISYMYPDKREDKHGNYYYNAGDFYAYWNAATGETEAHDISQEQLDVLIEAGEIGHKTIKFDWEQIFVDYGTITGVEGNVVTVDKFPEIAPEKANHTIPADWSYPEDYINPETGIDEEDNIFRIADMPSLGNRLVGNTTFVVGEDSIALSKNSIATGLRNKSVGACSATFGRDNRTGYAAIAGGQGNYAIGDGSIALGNGNTASGFVSVAVGRGTTASGDFSYAEGRMTVAAGDASHAEGGSDMTNTIANTYGGVAPQALGHSSHAEGWNTKAEANVSHAQGIGTIARGAGAHSEGRATVASGLGAHAEGLGDGTSECGAIGNYSHSEGTKTVARGDNSHAQGNKAQAIGWSSHAEGSQSVAEGSMAHAEGNQTYAKGEASHTEGVSTGAEALAAHAEGKGTHVYEKAYYGHAEGLNSLVSGEAGHAEGKASYAKGTASHAEGGSTEADGTGAHTEGYYTHAKGDFSHAEGYKTIAGGEAQHVQGKYNIEDALGEYAHIIGNGEGDATRSNMHTVDWSGNAWYLGTVTVGPGKKRLATIDDIPTFFVGGTAPNAVAQKTNASEENVANANSAFAIGMRNKATGIASFASGADTEASGQAAHAEGFGAKASGLRSHAQGNYTIASGETAHAEGNRSESKAFASHAEGNQTKAESSMAHAEGNQTIASGESSHAEGNKAQATGWAAHAQGSLTIASGPMSYAEGNNTIAAGEAQHVQGKFNIEDSIGQYAHIIGGGTGATSRKNIHTIDWNGNAEFAGKVKASEAEFADNVTDRKTLVNAGCIGVEFGSYEDVSKPILTAQKTSEYLGHANLSLGVKEGLNISYNEGGNVQLTVAPGYIHSYTISKDFVDSPEFIVDGANLTVKCHMLGYYDSTLTPTSLVIGNYDNAAERYYEPTITLGNITLTETKLKKILDFIDTIEG